MRQARPLVTPALELEQSAHVVAFAAQPEQPALLVQELGHRAQIHAEVIDQKRV